MTTSRSLSGRSLSQKREDMERAQAAALDDLDAKAEARQEKTRKLRRQRLEKTSGAASDFERWRKRNSSSRA